MGKLVSVVIPCKNEGKHLGRCLASVLNQNYSNLEAIVVDGMSKDDSAKIVSNFMLRNLNVFLFENTKENSAAGMNIGIRNSKGEVIIILGAHSEVPSDFILKSVDCLEKTGADVVGGPLKTVGEGYLGEIIALVLSSPFGTGTKFRYSDSAQYVDTVPFGAYKAGILKRVGLFNEGIPRSEDLELNHRIISAGGEIYMHPDIKPTYYCRGDLPGFIKQNFGNGYDTMRAALKNRKAVSLRHLIPFCFVSSLIILWIGIFFSGGLKYLLAADIVAYILANLFFSVHESLKAGFRYLMALPLIFLVLHLSYGAGSIWAVFRSALKFRLRS